MLLEMILSQKKYIDKFNNLSAIRLNTNFNIVYNNSVLYSNDSDTTIPKLNSGTLLFTAVSINILL